ncbi:MAG: NUDIX domain-containing protein [Lachnospiraceae bacterium]|nr:NUDIX domain-containing protein [Lachnospiraceae bacterium]MDD6505054.1 NUDIX domain-containing protein [Lachnospiraceae bacterium]
MEKWDLYTRYRQKTGEEYIRQDTCRIPEGRYHLVVHVWIRNSKGEYLISQRAANRPTYPLMWECVGGSVIAGETSLEGALRETFEEVGVQLDPKRGKILFSKIRNDFDGKKFRDIMDVWLFEYDGNVDLKNATTDEVADVRWMKTEKIKAYYDMGKLAETLDYFFDVMDSEEPDYSDIIGREVAGTIDRPLGSTHPRHPDMVYPVNYGYVDGVFAGDKAEQDVYVLGTKEPLQSFTGKVIAVYHRFNDIEDKWIVSLTGADIPDDAILGDIMFQEQFFYGKLYR